MATEAPKATAKKTATAKAGATKAPAATKATAPKAAAAPAKAAKAPARTKAAPAAPAADTSPAVAVKAKTPAKKAAAVAKAPVAAEVTTAAPATPAAASKTGKATTSKKTAVATAAPAQAPAVAAAPAPAAGPNVSLADGAPAPTPPVLVVPVPQPSAPSAVKLGGSVHASPSVRAFARELGVDLGQRELAGAQQHRMSARTIDDGGLDPHLTRPAIEHPDLVQAGAPPLELLAHMLRGGGADAAKLVRAGRSQAPNGRLALQAGLQQSLGHRVRRAAQANGGLPARGGLGDAWSAGQDEGQRPGPEGLDQLLGKHRDGLGVVGHGGAGALGVPLGIGHMHDQRVVGRAALGRKNVGHGVGVVRIGGQAVHGFGRQTDQLALGQRVGRAGNGVGVVAVQNHA